MTSVPGKYVSKLSEVGLRESGRREAKSTARHPLPRKRYEGGS
jgi:hypothetical protein